MELTAGSVEYGGGTPAVPPGDSPQQVGSLEGSSMEMTAGPLPAHRPGFVSDMVSEWTKIRSVRSTIWTLIIFAVVSLGLTALLTWLTLSNLSKGRRGCAGIGGIVTDPVNFILGTGLGLGQLAICVLGALVITSEYSSGVIRASLLAVPRRYPMFLAKALVFAVIVFVLGEIVAFAVVLRRRPHW